jgi:glycosyltransferase involved in cell wall biosynthesis
LRILVLTFYYQPDLCAGSFRVTPLVQALRAMAPPGSEIHVVTTLPNRYRSFAAEAERREVQDGVTISRVRLPAHRSGMIDQSRAFISFARGAWQMVRGNGYDLVFATSSRLMTLVLGAEIARWKKAHFYADVRDIFVDNIRHILPAPLVKLAMPLLRRVEARSIQRADRVNLVSPGFEDYFRSRFPEQRFSFFTNGIDPDFLDMPQEDSAPFAPGDRTTVLYAGNIGEGQGLHTIVPALARATRERLRFRIIGDGARKDLLAQAVAAAGADNVELLPPMTRRELISAYRHADVLFLHLNDYDAFRNVLPSKIFEYAALGKPLWAGVAGYTADFVRKEITNAAVFAPCDVAGALRAFDSLVHRVTPRVEFVAKFDRTAITRQLAADILSVGGGRVEPVVQSLDAIPQP